MRRTSSVVSSTWHRARVSAICSAADVVQRFLDAGFQRLHVLEAVTAVAASTITNYAGSIANPPLEEVFQAHAWRA
jgi:hypothetical protein